MAPASQATNGLSHWMLTVHATGDGSDDMPGEIAVMVRFAVVAVLVEPFVAGVLLPHPGNTNSMESKPNDSNCRP